MADGESNSLMHNGGMGKAEDGHGKADREEPREPLLKKQTLEPQLSSEAAVEAAVDAAMEALGDPLGNGASNGVCPQSLRVKRLAPEAILPSRGSASAAGYDLSSAYAAVVPARGKALVKTELSIAIPEGTYARVAPRSGLAWKHSIDVGAGVIDFDYRGPVGVILFNHADKDFPIQAGDRIAQLILEKICTPGVEEVDDLDATVRGVGGFGSTGVTVAAVAVEVA